MSSGLIRAAGGVVSRERDDDLEVAVVHRPRYDDWSLPKGKLDVGESALAAAVREIGEEIGARVAVTRRLGAVRYPVDGADKVVDHWAMRYVAGDFIASAEVDALVWLTTDAARDRLTHDADRDVLDMFGAVAVPDSVVVLVRHAKAGKRSDWSGDDRERPLEKDGRRQARRLTTFLEAFGPQRVLSADLVRCRQTVEPLAKLLGVDVEIAPEFSDESFENDPSDSVNGLHALAKPGSSTVVCSQGITIPGLIGELGILPASTSLTTRKSAAWVISYSAGDVVAADYYDNDTR